MGRRKNHPKSNDCASSVRSSSTVSANTKVPNNSNSNNSRTCQASNESRTIIKRNGIRVHSEDEEEEEEEQEDEESEGIDEDEVDRDEDDDDEDGDYQTRPEEFVKSNNNNSNNKKKKIGRKRRKRSVRSSSQNLSMDEISQTQLSNGSGGPNNRNISNGHQQSFKCPSCKITVDSASEFTKHIRQHNTVETASSTHCCSLCGKVLSSASSLDRHMLVHSGERPFKCSRCEMAFTTNGNMHRHMRTHHDGGYKSSSPLMNNSVNSNNNMSDDECNNNNNRKLRATPIKRKLNLTTEGLFKKVTSGTTGRNLWTKRSRVSVSENDGEENIDEKEEEMDDENEHANEDDDDDDDGDMTINNLSEDSTLQCPLCSKGFLCKSGLRRHLEGHPASDLKCKECDDTFINWQSLVKHLSLVHLKGVEASAVILGAEGEATVVLNSNGNSKAVDTGFHDLTFVDFSIRKFALIAKSACERHVRRPSSAYHIFQCPHCYKAFPCGSSLNMHLKTAHMLSNAKRKTSHTPPPSFQPTATCMKCQAAFATRRQLENHSLRHQATEQCATPYSRSSNKDSRQLQKLQQVVDSATADLAPDVDTNIDKKSFLALLELQSKNNTDDCEQEEDDDTCGKNHSKRNGNCAKIQQVTDVHANDFADIQSIIAVTSSSAMNIMKMGSSPAVTRPSSTISSELPASPRLADSVTASPELPSPNQNQSATSEPTLEPVQEKIDSNDKTEIVSDSHTVEEKETSEETNRCVDAIPLTLINTNVSSDMQAVDLRSSSVWNAASTPAEIVATPNIPVPSPPAPRPIKCTAATEIYHNQQKPYPQEESNSLKSLIDLTNNPVYDPPQDQPLDLVLQPMDLTINNSKTMSSSSTNDSSTSPASTSALPIDLSAPARQRGSSIISHRVSPLMASTPVNRRNSPMISPVPPQQIVAQQHQQQQPQEKHLFETSTPAFPSRFNPIPSPVDNYLNNSDVNPNQFQMRFHPSVVRRPSALPSTLSQQHPVIQSVGDNVIVPHTSSQQHVRKMDSSLRSMKSTPNSLHASASSAFLLKKQKQRRYRTERPFKCGHCAAGFTLRSNMERHIKQQHPDMWSSRSRGRKERSLGPPALPTQPASISPSLPLTQPLLLHTVTVPNVAFPSIPPPLNVTQYNPVLAAASNLSLTRPSLIVETSSSPPPASRLPSVLTANLNKAIGTISEEVKQAISNQIKQRQNVDVGNSHSNSISPLNLNTSAVIMANNKSPPRLEAVNDAGLAASATPAENNNGGKIILGGGTVRHIWRPAPQMETNAKPPVDDVDECGADLASVSKLLSTANQQSIQELFRKNRSGDNDDDDEMEDDLGGSGEQRSEESEEDQPLANFKLKESNDSHSKTTERSKDGRKSAYINAPNRVACPYCYRQFPWTSSLRRHVLTHTGQKPFKCPICPLWFTTKSNCDRHLSRKHGGCSVSGNGSGVGSSANCDSLETPEVQPTVGSVVNSPLVNSLSSHSIDCTARNAPDRPHRCSKCLSSTFASLKNLHKHVIAKHSSPVLLNTTTVGGNVVKVLSPKKENSESSNTVQEEQKEFDPSQTATVSPTRSERNSGESNSGSERCWGNESEESGEDLIINESGKPLFVCFVCLMSFANREHCLEHLKDNHPDEHSFLNNTTEDQLPVTSDPQEKEEKTTITSSESPDHEPSAAEQENS